MITRNNALIAATLAAGAAFVVMPAAATTAGAVSQHQAGLTSGPNTTWIGLQAVSSDGRVVGTVTKILAPGSDGDGSMLIVRSAMEAQLFRVPAAIATRNDNVVTLKTTADQLQKRT